MRRSLTHLRRTWRAWLLFGVSLAALALFVCSVLPRAPLSSRAGFSEALKALSARPTTVVVSPWDLAALESLPHATRATDTVPQRPPDGRVAIVGPEGFSLPAELTRPAWRHVAHERQRFDDVDVLWLNPGARQ